MESVRIEKCFIEKKQVRLSFYFGLVLILYCALP
jgi:hypothetical protein